MDRDGTINVDTDYVHTREEWVFCEGAPQAIKRLNELGYKVVVVTNQSGIIRGKFTLAQVVELHKWVGGELAKIGAKIDAWYIAPWHPNMHDQLHPDLLNDRKPGTGMFEKAIRCFSVDPTLCHMAGDKISDLQPAIKLGMKPHLIRSRFYGSVNQDFLVKYDIPVYDTLNDVINNEFES